MGLLQQSRSTKERLIDVAEGLFAMKDYRSVSVREITNQAQCNLAAVNYHFGNKYNLYLEVFRSRWVPRTRRIRKEVLHVLSSQDTPNTSEVVRAMAHAFLRGPLADEELVKHLLLITRELTHPTEAMDVVLEQAIHPFLTEFALRLETTLEKQVKVEQLLLPVLSVFANILYFSFAREAVVRLTGQSYDADFRRRLEDHITEFSLHGLSLYEKGSDKQ